MGDVVNDYFKRFYPDDAATAWETQAIGSFCGRRYIGDRATVSRGIFPLIECADGFSMSVQGHFGAYSYPRDDFADEYTEVEVWQLSAEEPLLVEHDRDRVKRRGHDEEPNRGESPYGYVPVATVVQIIEKHGGLKS